MNETFSNWLDTHQGYKTLARWNSGLASLIIKRHPTPEKPMAGFIHRVVTADPGYGKSTYAYKVMAKIDYIVNGYNTKDKEEDSYKFALDNMIYHPEDLFSRIYERKRIRVPDMVWCLDDASVHFGRQLYENDAITYRELQGLVPTMRTAVTGLLITTPFPDLLCKPLREFFRRKVDIQLLSEFDSYRRMGKQYEKKYYPDDVKYTMNIPFQDKFSCLIPEPFYSWYYDKKMDAEEEYARRVSERQKILRARRDKNKVSEVEEAGCEKDVEP